MIRNPTWIIFCTASLGEHGPPGLVPRSSLGK
jgi:hypothetical protein